MTYQYKFEFASEVVEPKSSFRTIHYLGSKLRVLDSIKDVIDELDPEKNGICDLFSGSGAVSQHLALERKIVSVDIQNYSHTICTALLKPVFDDFVCAFPEKVKTSKLIPEFLDVLSPVIELEENLISGKSGADLELVCDFLENSSLYSAINLNFHKGSTDLRQRLDTVIASLRNFDRNSFLAAKYFGGVYFSFKQAAIIDVILAEIDKADLKYRHNLLASLLSTASEVVNTVGKQFAQPIRPRTKSGEPKKGLLKQLRKDRNLDVVKTFEHWVEKYSKLKENLFDHQILKMDYKDALENLDDDVSLVYADPPYTRDHYSRFYHGLETLCLMDYPEVSTTKIGGTQRLSRGLYRLEREQSDFCIKSKAPKAFEDLFKIVSEKKKSLLLSYSPYDKSKEVHPRVVEIETLEKIAMNYFASVETRSLGKFTHNKLNRTDLHLEAEEAAEVLLICKN